MNRRDGFNLDNQIKDMVQDALDKGDFRRLNRNIDNIVKGALNEVKKSIDWKQGNPSNQTWNSKTSMINYSNSPNIQNKMAFKPTKYTVPVGQVSGILLTVFGAIGSSIFGLGILVLTLLGYLIGGIEVLHTVAIGLLPLFLISTFLLANGIGTRKRLKRLQRYISRMNGRNYCLIKELSSSTGQNVKSTVKDLQKMISKGMLPEGHIDDKETYFMLNNESYEQYVKLQESIRQKEIATQEERRHQIASQDFIPTEKNNKNNQLNPEIKKAIDEGRQYVMKIKEANIAIPGEEISRKLDRLEEVTRKTFDYVEMHPEKLPEIKKFTEYFLPTTLKLVDAYKKLDHQSVQGQNISSAKKEIEETMDTINFAFENLLDGLFEDMAMDISTDISVLETMLAQEGLTERNMKFKN